MVLEDTQYGENDMTLLDAVRGIHELNQAATIYAREPWTAGSDALVEIEPDEGGLPADVAAQGLSYFIEVSIGRDFLDDWAASMSSIPTLSERCKRLIQYVINDA